MTLLLTFIKKYLIYVITSILALIIIFSNSFQSCTQKQSEELITKVKSNQLINHKVDSTAKVYETRMIDLKDSVDTDKTVAVDKRDKDIKSLRNDLNKEIIKNRKDTANNNSITHESPCEPIIQKCLAVTDSMGKSILDLKVIVTNQKDIITIKDGQIIRKDAIHKSDSTDIVLLIKNSQKLKPTLWNKVGNYISAGTGAVVMFLIRK